MDLGPLRTLVRTLTQSAFAVSVTVTLPSLEVLTTTGIWVRDLDEAQPFGSDLRRRDPRRVLAIPRTDMLDALPRGTLLEAAEQQGGSTRTWVVDGLVQPMEPNLIRVTVVPRP